MVSYVHELLVLLFRNRSDAAADLLHGLDVPLPDYDRVSIGTTDVNDLQPAEYRDDLVLFLEQKQQKTLRIRRGATAARRGIPAARDREKWLSLTIDAFRTLCMAPIR
jgi:hypothetical protein